MLEQTSGRGERRATTVVFLVLLVEALWVFLHKYLPLDAGLWTLQADLTSQHMTGSPSGVWKLIPYPAANVAVSYVAGFLSFLLTPEIAVRLLMSLGGILFRGMGAVFLARVMRVRDEAVYYLIPVVVWSTTWFTGSLAYLIGEGVALWVIAFFLAQHHPRSSAYWLLTIGIAIVALFHALAFLFAAVVILGIAIEQRRSVHLSQGWLSNGRTVLSTLVPGLVILLLSFFSGQPIFRISTSGLLPADPITMFLFLLTPAPDVLEATFRGADILHAALSAFLTFIVLGCFARAFFLAIEEHTWQSRALKHTGWWLIVLGFAGILLYPVGIDVMAWTAMAVLVTLFASYSGGPAVRRTGMDRMLLTSSIIAATAVGIVNALSINIGSEASTEVLRISQRLIRDDAMQATQSGVVSARYRFVIDSSYWSDTHAGSLVAKINYSATAPMYLYQTTSFIQHPEILQPEGGNMRLVAPTRATLSPTKPLMLDAPEAYLDPANRVLAVLPPKTVASSTFGRWEFVIADSLSYRVTKGQVDYQLTAGALSAERPSGLAQLSSP